jgi:catalase
MGFTTQDGSFKYVKLHLKAQGGTKNFDAQTATKVAGENPDFLTQDLFEAIEQGNYPKWDVFVQVMEPKDAETYKWNVFDMTKVWPHKDYPLRQIGRLTMNRNVSFCLFPLSLYSIRDGKRYFSVSQIS